MSDNLPVPASIRDEAVVEPPRQPAAHERLLAYGALTVMVVEDMDIAGYTPDRFKVTIGGRPVAVSSCSYSVRTGRREIETDVGLVVVPSARDRALGAMLTVGGMAVPGA